MVLSFQTMWLPYTFVNNTDLAHANCPNSEVAETVAQMQQALHHWEGGLQATGGAFATAVPPP